MTTRSWGGVVAGAIALAATQPATAQSLVSGSVEAVTDERRRGLSWTRGAPALAGEVRGEAGRIEGGLRLVTLRGTPRASGAGGVADVDIGTGWDLGPIRARVRGIAHLFAGAAERADYAEVGTDFSYSLGPAQVTAGANWAPEQAAIGGSNLYLFATGNAGVPGTGLTLVAAIGRSSGTTDDPRRAARLRPDGAYTDWQLGIEHVTGRLTLGIDYVGTDIRQSDVIYSTGDRRHSGDAIVGRARVSF